MSKAYKCDRCGKLYESYKVTVNDSTIIYIDGYAQDLCKECISKLRVWFFEEGKNERSN